MIARPSATALVLLALGGCGASAPPAPSEARYAVVDRIAGPDGGYDYLSVDPEAKRLFVGREYGVMAVALDSGAVTPKLIEADDVAAVLILPGTSEMLSTAYDGDKAVLFDRGTGAPIAEIPTGKTPDAATYDPHSGLAFVMNAGSNDATVIDPRARKAVATIALGGKPEAGVADGTGRLFVNIEDTAEIAVIDVAGRAVAARYALPGCEEPTGIALDPASGTLIAACHNRTVKLIDAATGADRGSVAVCQDADGSIFDAERRLAYIPCNDGTLSIFRLDEQAKAQDVQAVTTQPGARTAALDPSTGRLYLAADRRVPDAKGEEQQVPGSFAILVVAPQ